jgi:hypothetical protein
MAFAVLLLVVAALFARSLQALIHVDVGYDRDHVLVIRIDPRSAGYDPTELPALSTRVIRAPGQSARRGRGQPIRERSFQWLPISR